MAARSLRSGCALVADPCDSHDREELAGVARSGAVVGLCPITEASLGDGVFPSVESSTLDGAFSIGYGSNVKHRRCRRAAPLRVRAATHSARTQLCSQRPAGRRRVVPCSSRALVGGLRSLGTPAAGWSSARRRISSRWVRRRRHLWDQPEQWLDYWILAARRPMVDCVWRGGRKLVQGGRHVHAEQIERRYRRVLAQLTARLE